MRSTTASFLVRFCCGGRKPGESRYCVSGSVAAGAFRFAGDGDGVRPSSASTRASLGLKFLDLEYVSSGLRPRTLVTLGGGRLAGGHLTIKP